MGEIRGKTMSQFCIDEVVVSEVLRKIPKSVTIKGISIDLGSPYAYRTKIKVPSRLKRLGVSYMRSPKRIQLEAHFNFGEVSRNKILSSIKAVAKEIDEHWENATVRNITLEKDGESAAFYKTSKEIRPDSTDLRRKLNVLGIDLPSDAKVPNKILRALSTKKYVCKMDIVPIRTIICSEMVA